MYMHGVTLFVMLCGYGESASNKIFFMLLLLLLLFVNKLFTELLVLPYI